MPRLLDEVAMALRARERLGPYEILGGLGAGGMGEVYRARDPRLDRTVAIKVLPASVCADPVRRRRFEQEARATGQLNHPNILAVYDTGEHEGAPYLVAELLEGETLRQRLQEGALPVRNAIDYALQAARGLAAAHDKGIVHRDLKPENLFVTSDGIVKVLDFGLAKLRPALDPADTGAVTSMENTASGAIVGTPGYMSPEQVTGQQVDHRTDIFSFGVVLYEMLTGRRAFHRDTSVETLNAILKEEPPEFPADRPIPPTIHRLVRHCLEKRPGERFQSARDLVFELEDPHLRDHTSRELAVDVEPPGVATAPSADARVLDRPPTSRRRRWAWVAATVFALDLALAAAVLLRPPSPPKVREVRRITAGIGAALAGGGGNWATIVSDGVRAYYIAAKGGAQGLWQVPLAGGDPVRVPLPFAGSPIYGYLRTQSALLMLGGTGPDDYTDDGMALWLVALPSGAPRRVGRLRAWIAGVSPDEKRLAFRTRNALWLADIDGGNARKLLDVSAPTNDVRWSPDGTRLRFSMRGEGNRSWIFETPVDAPAPRALWPGQQGEWVEDRGLYVFRRSGGAFAFGLTLSASGSELFAVAEPRWPWARSRPVQLTFGPIRFQSPVPFGPGGPLVAWGEIAASELLRFDRSTRRFAPVLEGVSAAYAAWSPDGRQLAWVAYPEGTLWRSLADGAERLQLTSAPLTVTQPRFSPDGKTIVFTGGTPERPLRSVYTVSADGIDGGKPRLLAEPMAHGENCRDACWAADGRSVLFSHSMSHGLSRTPGIYRVGLTGEPPVLEPGAEALSMPTCSRQGHVLADGPSGAVIRWAGRREWQKAPLGFVSPAWTRDGRSICGLLWDDLAASRIACYSFDQARLETVVTVDLPLLAVANLPEMFLDADDNPIVVVDRSARDLYALEWDAP